MCSSFKKNFYLFVNILNLITLCSSYLVILSDSFEPGSVIFDAGTINFDKYPRIYSLNVNKSAAVVNKLVSVNRNSGIVKLKEKLNCDDFSYPNLFTAYVDSISNGTVDYISFPVRIFVHQCNGLDSGETKWVDKRKLLEAKKWRSETVASFSVNIPSFEPGALPLPPNEICLRRSQLITNIGKALLPLSISSKCTIRYLDVDDSRFRVEANGGDLVTTTNACIRVEPPWKMVVTLEYSCDSSEQPIVSPSGHNIKIYFSYHKGDNDSSRVRREVQKKQPTFERVLYTASVTEEQPAGVSVCTVIARDPDGGVMSYNMVSLLDSRSQTMFGIDSKSGVVSTLTSLDRELLDVHYFRVTAMDGSFPPKSATTTLQVNVLDANDHAPIFEASSGEYQASVRESVPVGSTVTTVRATDKDIGHNAEVEYAIVSTDGGGLDEKSDMFSLDARSGVLTTRSQLDRERTQVYTLIITATDQALPPSDRKSSSATIVVRVLDDNDNYPQFVERTYTVNVPEDANFKENPVIATVKALDADEGQNAAIRYAIIGGNVQGQFSIDSQSGEVTLVKPLDYEGMRSYRIVIRAQDGGSPGRSNTTQLLVNVKDVNDNAPRFYTSLFQETVSESVATGYSIVRVQAYDADEGKNAELKYSLRTADAASDLPIAIDSTSGWIHTTRALDRESHSKFQFQVLAIDGGEPPKTATASIVITIQDVNDNDPVFNPKQYEAVIAEDDPPGTPVANVIATDPDENPQLHYEINGGNVRGRFAITTQNGRGQITVAQPLDYKQEKKFILLVRATDSGGRYDTATVYVNISDANNFAPVFDNAPYTASVFEDAPVGTTVLVVAATDGDVGANAQIVYSLGSSLGETTEFVVNPQTGAITTTKPLDRETQSGYLLTVTARDGGTPPLSDTTDVEISVSDINDNAPVFLKSSYTGSVSEDALVGTSVLQISATDADVGLNSRIRYTLSENEAFVIDSSSGVIRTAKSLDRESVAAYEIEALAIDRGSPPLSSSVLVTIQVEDVNDSPPAFESDKLVLYIAENSPVGSTVGEIYAKDPDEGVNAIVQYSIIGGEDSNSFSLVRRPGSEKAELLTMVELDYESSHKKFELVIRAASPPLRTDVHVEILVTDVNDNAPLLKDFQVIFNNFRDCFPAGAFGRIPAFDADVTDVLHYRIISGNNANLVTLNETSGQLSLSPQLNTNVPKVATMEVSVTDGVNEVKSMMQLLVRLVTDEMLFSSVTVRLADMTEEAFLSPLLGFFVEGLAAIVPCPKENIYVFSIQDDTDVKARILNVSFSARRPDGQFYSPQFLQERVYLNRGVLARLATVQVLPFDDNLCVREPCLNFEQCLTVLKFGNASGFISSDTVLFRPIYPVSTFACRCPYGFTGSREHYLCDTEVNLCYSNPCQNDGLCHRSEGGYSCSCKTGFAGNNCEIDLNADTCQPSICHSGSTCSPLVTGGFVCDDCAPSGTFEHYNQLCQLRGRSFPKNSFLTFPSLKQRHRLHIAMKFATLSDSGLLLYNGRYNEQHDFIALEIVEGGTAVQFSFSLGSDVTRAVARIKSGVNDGHWHRVTIDYFNKSASVSLDDCDTALTIKYGHKLGESCANKSTQVLESRCAILTETCHRYLDLTGPLQIGGLPALPASTTFQIKSKDFIGCIADLHIDHKLIDLNSYVADNGTLIGCPERKSYCVSEPCLNGGTCSDDWGTYRCECPEGWSGNDCSQSIRPAWRFHGDSMLSFNPLLRPIQLPWLIGLSLRTLQSTAFLINIGIGQNSSATLSIDGGYLVFTLDDQKIMLMSNKVNDGHWHRIEANWSVGDMVTLSTDNGRRAVTRTLNAKLQGLYVGKITIGSTEEDIDKKLGFNGCIQDVRIGTGQSMLQRATVRIGVTDGCADSNPCAEHTCTPHSHCVADWESYSCHCHTGFVGPMCVSVCEMNPCDHSGQCIEDKNKVRGYSCVCNTTAYSGEYCEDEVSQVCPVSWWGGPVCGPCQCPVERGYSADCNKTTGECYCKENHYQPVGSDHCLPCDCYATGSYGSDCDMLTGQCRCRAGVIGRACDTCPNSYAEITLRGCEVVYDGCPKNFAGGLWWPRTKFGEEAIENCPPESQGKASRVCDNTLGGWQPPDIFNCTSDLFVDIRRLVGQLEVGDVDITTFVAVEASNSLSRASNSTDHLYGADVLITQQILERLLNYETAQSGLNLTHSQDKDYIQNMVVAASHILSEASIPLWNRIEDLTNENAESILHIIENYLKTLAINQHDTYTDPFETVSLDMVIGLDVVSAESLFGYETDGPGRDTLPGSSGHESEKVILPDTSNILHPPLPPINFVGSNIGSGRVPPAGPAVIFPKYNNYMQDPNKFDPYSHLIIPIDLLGIHQLVNGEMSMETFSGSKKNEAVIGYAQYRSLGKILPMRYDMTVVSRWGVDLVVATPIFTVVAIVADKQGYTSLSDTVPLSSPVRLRLWLNNKLGRSPRSNPQCVHWTNARGFGEWSRAGCHTEMPPGEWWKLSGGAASPILVNCSCNHLSSFAVLVDLVGDEHIIETSVYEDLTSWICFSLSLWALAMATFMLGLLRAKTNSSAIYTNQAFCLFFAEALYLIALKGRPSLLPNEVPCKLIAMCLHYFWLCALSWWMVGSLHLYRMLTEVRDVNHGPMRFYYCLGYSLPAVVVCLAIGVRADQYGNVFFCWLSLYESVIWSLIGPACLIVTVNIGVLMMSLHAAFTLKDHVAGYGNLRRLLWLNVVSLPLLTACWLLCLISASEHDKLLTYAMSGAVVIQSWFLLIGYCIGNSRVRYGLYRLFLQIAGRKLPPLDDEDDLPCVATPRGSSGQQPSRSALAYCSTGPGPGVSSVGISNFEAARRHIGISTSSTTSRSTTKTGSSPYRSDTQLRQTSTSTSNYDQSASDVPCTYQRRHNTQHTSDSESEVSVDGRSLELASSHSSDDEESSARHRRRNQRNSGVTASGTSNMGYLPNIKGDPGTVSSAPRLHAIQPPPHLNIITNSDLFKPIYAPRWPSQTYSSAVEQVTLDETFVPHRWTNMSASTMSDNEAVAGISRPETKVVNQDPPPYYHPREPSVSDADDKSTHGEKYLFPYTAEEDHCGSVNGLLRPYSNELNSNLLHHHHHNNHYHPPLPPVPPPPANLSTLPSSPSPLMMHHDFTCPDISETEKDTSETPV